MSILCQYGTHIITLCCCGIYIVMLCQPVILMTFACHAWIIFNNHRNLIHYCVSSIKYISICCQSWIIFRYNFESRHRVGITKVPQRRVVFFRDSYLVWFCSGRVGSAARRSPSVALFFFNSFRVCRAQTEFSSGFFFKFIHTVEHTSQVYIPTYVLCDYL